MRSLSKSRSRLETTSTKLISTERGGLDQRDYSKTLPKYAIKLMNYIEPSLKNLDYSSECRFIASKQSARKKKRNYLPYTSRDRFKSPNKNLHQDDIEYIKPNPSKPVIPYICLSEGNLLNLKPVVYPLVEESNSKINEAISEVSNYNRYSRRPKRNYKDCLIRSVSELKRLNIDPSNTAVLDKIVSKHPYDKEGSKAFLKACKSGDETALFNILHENKFIVNCYDYTGMTGLHWATIRNHVKIVRILLQHRTIIDAVDFVIYNTDA